MKKYYFAPETFLWLSLYKKINKTLFIYPLIANGRCQSLLQSTRMVSNPLLMVDIKVYNTVNENCFKPFDNGGCQCLLQSMRMVSNPLLMVDVKVY